MSDPTTISALPAGSALTGAEIIPVDQGGVTVRTTAAEIAGLAGGGSGAVAWGDITGSIPTQSDLYGILQALIGLAAASASGNLLSQTSLSTGGTYTFQFSGNVSNDQVLGLFYFGPLTSDLILAVGTDPAFDSYQAKRILIKVTTGDTVGLVVTFPDGWLLDASVSASASGVATTNTTTVYEVLIETVSKPTPVYIVRLLTQTAA